MAQKRAVKKTAAVKQTDSKPKAKASRRIAGTAPAPEKESGKQIRVGLVGIGRAGLGMHCPELDARKEKFQVVAACDIEKQRRDWMVERYGCKVYRDIEDLVADPEVELVSIATRSPDHVPHALLALAAGKSVFVEKPIAISYEQACLLKTAVKKAKGNLYVRHNRRFEPGFNHIRQIMHSGVLGEVFEVKLRRVGYGRRDDWQSIIRCGGGQLLNWGPHIVDHALQLLESPVAEQWSDLKRIASIGDAEDHLKIIFKGENGRIVDMEISGGAAFSEPEYLIFGSKGALRSSGNKIELRYLDPKHKPPLRRPKVKSPDISSGFGSPDSLQWIEETIDVAPDPRVDCDSIWDALYDSMRNGADYPITLDEALAVMKAISQAKKNTPFEMD